MSGRAQRNATCALVVAVVASACELSHVRQEDREAIQRAAGDELMEDRSTTLSATDAARVALGRALFFDVRLSRSGSRSCGSCHRPNLSFTDRLHRALGAEGDLHPRNTPSLANVVERTTLGWASAGPSSLEAQVLVPLLDRGPVIELGNGGHERELISRLRGDTPYPQAFRTAFGLDVSDEEPITVSRIASALAAFERTMTSSNAPFDRWTRGQAALPDEAEAGRALFFSSALRCGECHGGASLAEPSVARVMRLGRDGFANTGLYDVDGTGSYPALDQGLFELTGNVRDRGRFRIPSLRNVAVTGPYFHDGSASTLDDVLDHYARGGRVITDGPNQGDGAKSPLKDSAIAGFDLDDDARRALRAFFESLTDESFLIDGALAEPPADAGIAVD